MAAEKFPSASRRFSKDRQARRLRQFAIPSRRWSAASAFLELAMGAHRAGRSLLYIHPGTLYWGLPLRIGTPPEVAVLTLRRSATGESSLEQTSVENR